MTNSAPTPNKVSVDCNGASASNKCGNFRYKINKKRWTSSRHLLVSDGGTASNRSAANQVWTSTMLLKHYEGIPALLNPLAVVLSQLTSVTSKELSEEMRSKVETLGNMVKISFDVIVTSTVGTTAYTTAEEVAGPADIGDGNLELKRI